MSDSRPDQAPVLSKVEGPVLREVEGAVYPHATWRLILDGPHDGATNMAVDEAIVTSVVRGTSPPMLRFYAWSPPCLSLGRGQPWAEADRAACRAAGVDVVRRPTGGRAILHTDELTYSLALLHDDPRAAGDVLDSYRRLSVGLLDGLQSLGVEAVQVTGPSTDPEAGQPQAATEPLDRLRQSPVCFEMASDYEITVGGRKLVGSAQWRSRGGVLQHGSLPLHGDLARIIDYLIFPPPKGHIRSGDLRAEQRRYVHARATTLEEAMGCVLPFAQVAQALADGFARTLNVSFVRGQVTSQEQALAAKLRRDRYAAPDWS
jgi:lipoate-protein ligase A